MSHKILDRILVESPEAEMRIGVPILNVLLDGLEPKKLNAPRFCSECKGPVGFLSTDTSEGKIALIPERCGECRNKVYQEALRAEERNQFGIGFGKCGGYQNRPAFFRRKEVVWEDISESFSFQEEFLEYIENMVNGNVDQGVFVFGSTGTGKTFLAKLLHNELVASYRHSCFIKAVDLAIVLRKAATGFDKNAPDILKQFRNVETLIVDDYGTQKNTEFVREAIFSIFDYRYDNRKRTILTTNLTLDDIAADDPRMASRLQDKSWIKPIRFTGKDFRQDAISF